MASYRSREGKALAPASQLCNSCERETAYRYCPECTSALCQHCERGHKKNKYTKAHKIINFEELVISQTGTQLKNAAKCKKHSRDIRQICEDCLVLLCAECQSEHRGHNMSGIANDQALLHNVCTQEVKRLLDLGVDLHKDKKICEDLIKKHEETSAMIQQKGESLIQTIKDSLEEFKRKTQKSKDGINAYLNEKSTGVSSLIKQSDEQVKKLTDLKWQENMGVLMQGIVESNDLNEKGKQRHDQIANENNSKTLDKFAKRRSGNNQLAKDAIQYFEYPSFDSNLDISKSLNTLDLKETIPLPPHYGEHGWRFCFSHQDVNLVVLIDRCGRDILTLNLDARSFKAYKAQMDLFKMICVDVGSEIYVAIDDRNKRKLHLLNKTFNVIGTGLLGDKEHDIWNLKPLSDNNFLMIEVHEKKQITKFTFCEVVDGKFTKKKTSTANVVGTVGALLNDNGNQLTLVDRHDIFTRINLKTGELSQYNMLPYKKGRIYFVDADYRDNLIIGYETGDIRVFREIPFLDRITLKTGVCLTCLIVKGKRLLVCDKNNIYVYE